MEIWLDSIQTESIKLGAKLGILHGITTNPSIIKEPGKKLEEIWEPLLQMQRGPVAVQVTADFVTSMIEQADALREFSERSLMQEELELMRDLIHNYKFKSKLLAASLKSFDQINLVLRLGLPAITLKQELFAEMTQDFSLTVNCIKKFDEDWKKSKPS
ncbi:MAG: hypothetical protein HYZ47_04690 [Simkania negevensis]|nr:hypothetical protein [Simkania negevensis]